MVLYTLSPGCFSALVRKNKDELVGLALGVYKQLENTRCFHQIKNAK